MAVNNLISSEILTTAFSTIFTIDTDNDRLPDISATRLEDNQNQIKSLTKNLFNTRNRRFKCIPLKKCVDILYFSPWFIMTAFF